MKRIVIVFYIVVVAVLAAATIVEKYLGTEYVSEHIFGAWWFYRQFGERCYAETTSEDVSFLAILAWA